MKIFLSLLLVLSFLNAKYLKTNLFFIDKNGKKTENIGVRGKISILEIKSDLKNIKVKDSKREYPVIKLSRHRFVSFIPVKYRENKKSKVLKIGSGNLQKLIKMKIKKGVYKKEFLKVSPKKVHLNERDRKRASLEYKEAMKIYNTFTPKKLWKGKFILPIRSLITSSFGNARVFNNQLKSYHGGVDFRAKEGTKIRASNDGKVVLAKNRFYAGNSVIINHGLGIYTGYYHLSEFKVKRGDKVKKGEVIGLSGKTGRVTGAHLHFSMRINGVAVDPLQGIKSINASIK